MRVNIIKEASSHEQRKRQAKSKFKEKTAAHPERKKAGKESKGGRKAPPELQLSF
jgi:hypothetical protein